MADNDPNDTASHFDSDRELSIPTGDDLPANGSPLGRWVADTYTNPPIDSREGCLDHLERVSTAAEKTEVPIEPAFDVAKAARVRHRQYLDVIVQRGHITASEKRSLIDAFDRLITAWVNSPAEIHIEITDYEECVDSCRPEEQDADTDVAGDGKTDELGNGPGRK